MTYFKSNGKLYFFGEEEKEGRFASPPLYKGRQGGVKKLACAYEKPDKRRVTSSSSNYGISGSFKALGLESHLAVASAAVFAVPYVVHGKLIGAFFFP